MSEAVNYLQVLSESLDKKIDILKQLEVLTAAQKEIVDKGEFDEEAFNDNVESKAALIDELEKLAAQIEKQMRKAAADLNFEAAAELRDKLIEIRKKL